MRRIVEVELIRRANPVTGEWGYSVLLGNGDGSFQAPVSYPQAIVASPSYSVVADFNGDHKLDIAASLRGTQSFAVMLGNGDGTFAAPVYYFDDGGALSPLVAADFNSDGNLDIAAGGSTGTALLFGNGDGTFQPATFPTSLNGFIPFFTGDLNNDGKADLISPIQVALGNGDGTFSLLPQLSYSVSALGDLNGDGKLDVIVFSVNPTGHPIASGMQLGNGDGTFGPFITLLPPSGLLFSTILITDMNGDGRPDIVFQNFNFTGNYANGFGVLLNTTAPGFDLSATALSPATVTAGSSATSTVTIAPTFGFNGTVTLGCAGLPTGASCSFNPPSVTLGNNASSSLTINTLSSTPPGTYSITVTGTSGTSVNNATVSLTVASQPDFTVGPAPGSPTSQTIQAGQNAVFNLALTVVGGFSGSVSLGCSLSPAVTPAPACNLSSSSVQLSGTTQSVTVTVGTTAPVTSGTVFPVGVPPAAMPPAWTALFLVSGWFLLKNRKQLSSLAAPLIVLTLALWGVVEAVRPTLRPERQLGPTQRQSRRPPAA